MTPVTVDGSKLTFHIPEQGNREWTVDFNPGFQWVKRVGDDVIVAVKPGDDVTFIDRREPDGSIRWTITRCLDDDRVDVSPDDLQLSVNDTSITLPGELRSANVRPDAILVVVYANEQTGDRNVYRYDRDGRLRWRIGERDFSRGHAFANAGVRPDGRTIKAQGDRYGLGAIVDYETGKVLYQEDPR